MIVKHWNFFLILLLMVIAGCEHKAAPPDVSQSGVKSYNARGVVRQIADDRHQVTIQHEAIDGYMPAMTMEFAVKDTNQLNGISPADEVTFKLVVGENDSWIENVRFVAHRIENVTNNEFTFHADGTELKLGDALPDYELMTEDGKRIRFSDFRGRALAFTFFFTRCPLPDYCPRMNKNFEQARELIISASNAPTNWQFLSISFDPDFDKPEVLSSYADLYRGGNPDRWLFAAASINTLADLAPRLDLMVMRQGTSISHNMRTVVLDPQGRIYRQFDGNEWTPQQLSNAMLEAARMQTQATPH